MRFPLCFVLALAGCVEPPAPAPDLARAPLFVPPPPPAPKVEVPLPDKAEVELAGKITRPPNTPGPIRVFVTDGECWKPATRALGSGEAGPTDAFFVEVYVKQGTQLWVCAALIPPKGKPVFSASAPNAPFLGRGAGEVEFKGIQLELKKGAALTLPVLVPR